MKEKETIKLLHLFSGFMNLYGEYANLLSLKRFLEKVSGKECTVTAAEKLSDTVQFEDYDFIYIGSGTEKAQKRAIEELVPFGNALKEAAEKGTLLLFTGNAWEIFGSSVTDAEGKAYQCMGVFDFKTEETKKRITGDVVCENTFKEAFSAEKEIYKLLEENPTIGFINKCSIIKDKNEKISCFKMLLGTGDDNTKGEKPAEGGYFENFFGTHLIGPLLIKNPHLLKFFAWKIFVNRDEGGFAEKALSADTQLENSAYLISLNELKNRIAQEAKK